MFDLDVARTLEKLEELDGIILASNPCLDLWFILHYREQRASLSTASCLKILKEIWPNDEKWKLTETQKRELMEFLSRAKERVKQLRGYENPSTSVNVFIEYLEEANRTKNKS